MAAGRPAKNNASFFGHDHDMRNHRKIKAIRARFGMIGYGVWVMFLEVLTESERNRWYRNEMETELLAGDFGVSVAEIRDVLDYCVLLELLFDEDGFLYSRSLDEKLRPVYEKRELARDRARGQGRDAGKFSSNTDATELSVTEIPQIKGKVKGKEKGKRDNKKSTNVDSKFRAYDFPLPFDSEEFKELWRMFCDHRVKIKNALSENSAKLIVNKLAKEPEKYARAMLSNTIESDKYPSVYELKPWEKERIDKEQNVNTAKQDPPKRRYLNDQQEWRNPNPTVFFPQDITVLPFPGEEFKAEWTKWSEMIWNANPMTQRVTYDSNLEMLASKPEKVAVEMLKRAIKGGFKQIYELKPEEEKLLTASIHDPIDDDERRQKQKYDLYLEEVWIEFKNRKKFRSENSPPGADNWGSRAYPDDLSIYHEQHGLVGELKPTTVSTPPKLVW